MTISCGSILSAHDQEEEPLVEATVEPSTAKAKTTEEDNEPTIPPPPLND